MIYLHGFNSAFAWENVKVAALARVWPVVELSYDSFASYEVVLDELVRCTAGMEGLRIVGTSLGGFFAAHLAARLGLPAVLINPCYDPHAMLDGYVGREFVNFITGAQRVLTPEVGESYRGKSLASLEPPVAPLVLLDAGDELLDAAATACALACWPQHCFAGGSHRFEHIEAAIPLMRDYWSAAGLPG